MHQFFVEDEQVGRDFITITGPDVHHIRQVLHMRAGEEVRISSKGGKNYKCRIMEVSEEFVQMDILDSEAAGTELRNKIYLFQALPKGDRMETIIQKAVELGAYEIIPVAMKYCVVKLDEKKAQAKRKRWQAIAESAAKQSKRSRIPSIHSVLHFSQAVTYALRCDQCFVPYENERGMRGTEAALRRLHPGESVSIMIGPEGGFAEEEIQAVREKMQIISLGRRILRTDTAAITMLSLLMLQSELQEEKEDGSLFG